MNKSVLHGVAAGQANPPERSDDAQEVGPQFENVLWPAYKRRITRAGIVIAGIHYRSPALSELALTGVKTVIVRVDPNGQSKIDVLWGKSFVSVPRADASGKDVAPRH